MIGLFATGGGEAMRRECGLSYPEWEADAESHVYYQGTEQLGHIVQGRMTMQGGILRSWLVCTAFHGPRPAGRWCLHWDDNPLNDRPENLRWGSRADNTADAIRNGRTRKKGARMSMPKSSTRSPGRRWATFAQAAEYLDVNERAIRQMVADGSPNNGYTIERS